MRLKTKKSIYPKIIIAIIAVSLLGYVVLAKTTHKWPFDAKTTPSDTSRQADSANQGKESKIDDTPATSEDQQQANEQKQSNYEQSQKNDQESNSSQGKKTVSVTITTLYQEGNEVHANGFVSGVIENDGTCTFTLTDESGKKVTSSRKGHENATNTTCGQSSIKTSQLHPGKWTASLSYSSATANGTNPVDNAPSVEVK